MNHLATINQDSQVTWTPEQMRLITDTVAKGATPDELKLFLYRCKIMKLDPLKPGQIHFVKYGNSPGTIVVGIEGFRSIAGRTGKISGVKRGVVKDGEGKLVAAWAEVYRSDWKEPAREEVPFAEYNTGKGPWAKMPETMLKKVAEAATLRMAFPDDLGGIYTKEEMDQAEQQTYNPHAAKNCQPEPGDGVQPELPKCDCGGVLKFTAKKSGRYPDGCWYCPEFKNAAVKHTEPVQPAEYEQWKKEMVLYALEQASKDDE